MLETDKKQFGRIVRSTMLVCGGSAPDADVLRIWWASLQKYGIDAVSVAFSEYAMRGKYAPKPADILAILERMLPDVRPGADEAWAMIPKDEYTSAVVTEEMLEALGVAQPLIDAGDKIAARMAFKETYIRIVEQSKLSGKTPKWIPSLGQDKEGRESAMAEAIRLGRIDAQHAIGIAAPDRVEGMLQSAGEVRLALEYKAPEKNVVLERIAQLKAVITTKD